MHVEIIQKIGARLNIRGLFYYEILSDAGCVADQGFRGSGPPSSGKVDPWDNNYNNNKNDCD